MHLEPGAPQPRDAAPAHLGVRVPAADEDARDARLEDRQRARRRAPLVIVRLERHVHVRAARRLARGGEGVHLCVRHPGALVVALAQHAPFARHHRAHDGIGAGAASRALRLGERERHEALVQGAIALGKVFFCVRSPRRHSPALLSETRGLDEDRAVRRACGSV